ncbi:hypothetical protein GGF32_001289 [Allomyces javanicus]|nr:hypothetical protein GGF32_001289 [Allomyces javanicus]
MVPRSFRWPLAVLICLFTWPLLVPFVIPGVLITVFSLSCGVAVLLGFIVHTVLTSTLALGTMSAKQVVTAVFGAAHYIFSTRTPGPDLTLSGKNTAVRAATPPPPPINEDDLYRRFSPLHLDGPGRLALRDRGARRRQQKLPMLSVAVTGRGNEMPLRSA